MNLQLVNLRNEDRSIKSVVNKEIKSAFPLSGLHRAALITGVNGAGKTTTFQMLTGEVRIGAGEAFVHGWSVDTQWRKVCFCRFLNSRNKA